MSRVGRVLNLWFSPSMPVGRMAYAITGIVLFVFKYLVDATIVKAVAQQDWTPLSYVNPSFSVREFLFTSSPPWLAWGLGLWTLPFLWIGVSMTVRRAKNAGLPAGTGLVFFIPAINYVWMLILCVLPTSGGRHVPAVRSPPADAPEPLGRALLSAGVGALVGVIMVAISTLWLEDYGLALFVGTPFVMGFLTALVHNVPVERTRRDTFWAVQLSFALTGGVILLAAFEGLICLIMAYPLAAVIGGLGGILGRTTAVQSQLSIVHGLLLAVTPAALLPVHVGRPVERVVTTVVDIDAPPEAVWEHVVAVSDLPPPQRLMFKVGIAYPIRAQIRGHGVGAVRQCEFSTGSFVEPITAWEEARLLAFDVIDQPPVLEEWSPYQHVTPAHLLGALKVHRGEFRLTALPGGRTELTGRTWYTLEMFPAGYWAPITSVIIHRIHERVLAHIRSVAVEESGTPEVDGLP